LVNIFIQSNYHHTPETNRVSRARDVTAVLLLQHVYMVHNMLSPVIKVMYFSRQVRSAQYGCCIYFFDVVLSRYVAYFLYEFQVVRIAPIVTDIAYVL
jgi:hypothetical protein